MASLMASEACKLLTTSWLARLDACEASHLPLHSSVQCWTLLISFRVKGA